MTSSKLDDWEEHWARYADSASLNPAQAYRRRLSLQLLTLRQGDRLLDIGSGQGDFACQVISRHPNVSYLGLELSRAAVDISRRKAPDGEFIACNLLENPPELERRKGWATHALCSEVLEHVDHPELLLRTAGTCLATGAKVVITVPGGPMSAFDKHIGHRRHYTVETLNQLMMAARLEPIEVFGSGWPFFNLYRMAVIARGDRLIDDVKSQDGGGTVSPLARAGMGVFRSVFRMNVMRSRWGWQMIGVGRKQ